ncbi:DNA mismatch repair protein MutT [Mesorhizobium sp. Root554]|uniref:NUDIX domain-containing protein n=1 Tax=unclassified Mesorhizobium TaxID=325217 RepID=UPI000700D17C|nr:MULTISPECIES: NUDIX domain-containing protein [unclassified Mesorhizobium]KQZ14361.1 DNA mismatch repair protein MutT [Mesorhizobium sp. Root1471]KQZ36872.1 DNA mismatch repair protein MutT [Mesorhizobium sp. Root554]
MSIADPDRQFRQTGWAGLRAKLFHLFFVIKRPMTLGVRGLVHDREANAVFLIRHTYVPGWQLPGGGVETGETLGEALERELAEEGNIVFTAPPLLKSVHFNRGTSRRDHVGFYLIEAFRQSGPKLADHEIAEAGFFPLDALPDGLTPGTRRRLAEVFDGAVPSPYW